MPLMWTVRFCLCSILLWTMGTISSTIAAGPDLQEFMVDGIFPQVIDARLDERGGVIDYLEPQPFMVLGDNLDGVTAVLVTEFHEIPIEITSITSQLILLNLTPTDLEIENTIRFDKGSTSTTRTITKGPLLPEEQSITFVVQELDLFVNKFGPIAFHSNLTVHPSIFNDLLTALKEARDQLNLGHFDTGELEYFEAMDIWLANRPLFIEARRDLDVSMGLAFVSQVFAIDRALRELQARDFNNKFTITKTPAIPTKKPEFNKATLAGLFSADDAKKILALQKKVDEGTASPQERADLKKLKEDAETKLTDFATDLFNKAREALPTQDGKEIFDQNKDVIVKALMIPELIKVLAGVEEGFTIAIVIPSVQLTQVDAAGRAGKAVAFYFKAGFVPTGTATNSVLEAHEAGHLTIADACFDALTTFLEAFVRSKLQGQSPANNSQYQKALEDALTEGRKKFRDEVGDTVKKFTDYDTKTKNGKEGTAKDQTDTANAMAVETKEKAAAITPKPPQ